MECLELSGMFAETLENKNVESIADNGGLACEVSEGSKGSIRYIVYYFGLRISGSGQFELKCWF